jgi:transposase
VLDLTRETDLETLRKAALLLNRENRKLLEKVLELQKQLADAQGKNPESLQQRLALLEEQLAQRNQELFGRSSEKRSGSGEQASTAGDAKPKGHGPKAQPKLPVEETRHTLDAADCTCEKCGGALEEMQGQTEDSEEIDVVERRFVLRTHKRQKYRCRCNAHVDTALGPPKLFPGARYSVGFAVEVAVDKYCDHLPLERQVRKMEREGLEVDSQTLWDQLERLARVLRPLSTKLQQHVLSQEVLGADESRWHLLGKAGRDGGELKQWQIWCVACPTGVHYSILESRGADAAERVLKDFRGIVMCDGYDAYESLSRTRGGSFVTAHCWAHARRKFVECEAAYPKQAAEALAMFGELYGIEGRAPPGPDGQEERRRLRDTESRAVVKRLQAWAIETPALKESGLGKALGYLGGQWKGLVRFLEDPRVPLDNNATERALRGPVVGRKNHYGSKSKRGTEVAALLYGLVETCKLAGVDPKRYLREATYALLRGDDVALPHEFAVAG